MRFLTPQMLVMLTLPLVFACELDGTGGEAAAVCGNGVIDAGETCDDGNTDDGDRCSSVCTADTGDIDEPEENTLAVSTMPTCTGADGPGDLWQFYVDVTGPTAGLVKIDIVETSAPDATRWSELGHTMTSSYALQLTAVEGTGNVEIATDGLGKTAFDCGSNNGTSLAFMATLFDTDGAEDSCVVWGYKASSDAWPGTTCECIDEDGDCTN